MNGKTIGRNKVLSIETTYLFEKKKDEGWKNRRKVVISKFIVWSLANAINCSFVSSLAQSGLPSSMFDTLLFRYHSERILRGRNGGVTTEKKPNEWGIFNNNLYISKNRIHINSSFHTVLFPLPHSLKDFNYIFRWDKTKVWKLRNIHL